MKQGTFAQLDKIETAAKARAARDFGISTELALDMEDEDNGNGEVVSTLARSTVVSQAPHVVDAQPAPAMATSASPKPAQARQEPAQGADLAITNEAKIRALLKEYKALRPEECSAKTWYFKTLREAFHMPEGPLPASDAYTAEHVIALAQFVKPYRKQAAQSPV